MEQKKVVCDRIRRTNQNNVAVKSSPLKLRLNNEEMGTTDDTSVLSKKLKEVFKDREDGGVLREGTNEIEKTVHLQSDRSVSAEEMAKLYGVLNGLLVSPILIPVEIPAKNKNTFPRPNPLMLVVYAGSDKYRPASGGVEIGFMGELSENRLSGPSDKGAIAVVVEKNGTYTMEGKQISAVDLKTTIENRLKTKEKNKKIIFVQAENYGNIEDVASIAASAGAVKVYFSTKNIEHKENGISFSLSPAYFKEKGGEQDPLPDFKSVGFNGPDLARFEIVFSTELFDQERAEAEIKSEYDNRKKSFSDAEVSMTEIDGASGVMTIMNDEDGYSARWFGFRKKDGKQQVAMITFASPREQSDYSKYEFLQIIKSIKFN